jgi:hypothetical protein
MIDLTLLDFAGSARFGLFAPLQAAIQLERRGTQVLKPFPGSPQPGSVRSVVAGVSPATTTTARLDATSMSDKRVMAVTIGASLLVGGALGLAVFGPSLAGAATGTTNPPAATTAPPAASSDPGTFKSNEDPAHEANESPEREAEENSGQGFHGGGRHGFNEDPAHEASESPEREAEEDAGRGPAAGGSSSSSSSDTGTLQ